MLRCGKYTASANDSGRVSREHREAARCWLLAAGRWLARQAYKRPRLLTVVVRPSTARQDHTTHDLGRKPASAQKSHLACPGCRVDHRADALPILFSPHLTGTLLFGGLQRMHRVSIQSNAMLLKLLTDAQVAKPLLARGDARLGKSLL